MRILYFICALLITPLYAKAEFNEAPPEPENWLVKEESWIGHTDPNVCVDQFESHNNYYVGNGKIIRQKFIEPGHFFGGTQVIQLDKETTTEFEEALANVRKNLDFLASNASPLSKGCIDTGYTHITLTFRNEGDSPAAWKVLKYIKMETGDNQPHSAELEDLDFVLEKLYTYIPEN